MVATVFDSPEPTFEPVVGETPMMMSNPTLIRRLDKRKTPAAMKFGIPAAVVIVALAAGALLATQKSSTPMVTPASDEAAVPAQTAAVTPLPAPPIASPSTIAPEATPAVVPVRPARLAVNPPVRVAQPHVRIAPRTHAAVSADSSGADVSAKAPIAVGPVNPPVMSQPQAPAAPVIMAPPPAAEPAPQP